MGRIASEAGLLLSKKRIILGGFLIMLTLWSTCSISSAATVHVAVNGDDENPGSAEEPVATVSKALQLVWDKEEPSEIIIHKGVYPGDVSVGNNEDRLGGPRPHILIRAAQNPDGAFQEVIFEGGRKIEKAEQVPGKPGIFKVPGQHSYHYRTHVWEADTRIRYTMVADLTAVERFPASFWYSKSEVFFHTADNQPPEAHDIGISRYGNGITLWRPNVTVRGLQFRNFLVWRWSCGVELRGADTAAEDCRVWNSIRGLQIVMEPEGTRVVRCRADDCGGGVYSQGKRAVIEDCRLYKIRDRFMVPCYPQDDTGIQFYSPAAEGEVRRNLCVGFCNGIFVKCKTSEFIVEHNTCLDGITFGMGCTSWDPKTIFRYNIVVGFAHPILGHDSLTPTNVVDSNCIWNSRDQDALQRFLQAPRETGTGKYSIAADPLFAAPVAGDYRLLPDSPCARMEPTGETCGALDVVGSDFRDVQPPHVQVTAASPAQRAASVSGVYLERDPWLGDAPGLMRDLPDEWITPGDTVTLEIHARNHVSKPDQMQIRIDGEPWGQSEPFQQRKEIQLPPGSRVAAVRVCDVAGNWSEPVSLKFRQGIEIPQLKAAPVIYTNTNGAVISFETDTLYSAKVEFGQDSGYGTTSELPANAQRSWITDTGESRVTNYAVLLPPLVEYGATYHYRIILEDESSSQMATDDGLFTLEGEPKSYFVSPRGEDVENGGSREKPWHTIQFAVDRALPGDRVILLPGLYPGESILSHGGLEGAPITIEAEQPGTVILDGRREVNTCLYLAKAAHVVIDGLEVRWFGKADTFYSSDKAGIFVTDSPHVTILNCKMWNDFWMGWPIGSGIAANRSPGLVADHNVIYQVEEGINLYYNPGARVTYNTILNNMYGAVKFIYSAENSVSRNNSFCFSGNDQYVVIYQDKKEFESFDSDYNNLGTELRSPEPGEEIVPRDPFFRNHGSKAIISVNGERYNSLKGWQKATGKDLHSIFKDPVYVDPENWDFHLQPDSPNIGAGEDGAVIGALGIKR